MQISCRACGALLVHSEQQFFVAAGFFHLVLDEFHSFHRGAVAQEIAQHPHAGIQFGADEQIVATCARSHNVDSREDALVRQLAVELKFHIARAFEFLENHFIHLATGFDECSGNDGEAAATLNVASSAEESFWFLQRIGIYTKQADWCCRRDPDE